MSVESKIRELMQGKTEPAQLKEAAEPLGATGMQKDTTLKAANEGDRNTRPRQGSSEDCDYEERDQHQENQGAIAAKSVGSAPRPTGQGAGEAPNFKTVGDPTSVINMPSSKGNVPMESVETDVKAQLVALLGEDTSEEFRTKAASLFEAAVIARVNLEMDKLAEAIEEKAAEHVNEAKEEMVEKVDAYLSYVVEQWVADNQVAVDTGLRTEIAEQFISGLKNLFEESYIEVPEDKYDVIEGMQDKIEGLEGKLNEAVNDNIHLSKEVITLKKAKIFESQAKDLAETEAEKLHKLIEGVDFESDDLFEEKVAAIKETYFPKTAKTTSADQLTEDVTSPSSFDTTDIMSKYVQAISRSAKR